MKKEYAVHLIEKNEHKNNIRVYLSEAKIINGKTYKSSYYTCLEHARDLTGRCLKNGSIDNKEKIGNWAGACLYMILIDHVGGLFRRKGKIEKNNNKFLTALSHFSNLSDDHARILYQLRNSFVHSFNLFNFPENDKLNQPKIFSVHRGSPLIFPPEIEWEGNAIIKKENQTHVSLFELGELVEQMHKSILENLDTNNLEIKIPEEGNFTIEKILEMNTICY